MFGIYRNRVFRTDALFIRTENTVGARSAQWSHAEIGEDRTIHRAVVIELARTASVRADRRLCADEKRIRAQSAILDKTPTPCLVLTITMLSVRMRCSSVEKTWLARAARNGRAPTSTDVGGYIELRR